MKKDGKKERLYANKDELVLEPFLARKYKVQCST